MAIKKRLHLFFIRYSTFFFHFIIFVAFVSQLFTSCKQPEFTKSEFALGTVCTITLFEQEKPAVHQEIFNRIREIENRVSVNIPSSDISRINASAGIQREEVHDDVFMLIDRAVFFAQLSDGAFDPSVGPLVLLWGIGNDNFHIPSFEEINEALPLIDWKNIELNEEKKSVFLKSKNMALDLGGIAKGYAADEAASIIKKAGIKRAIIDLGGNIIVIGEKKDKTPWRVGLRNPAGGRGEHIGIVSALKDSTVVTSGVYERFFFENGIRHHHILSPSSGYPVDNDLLSVTIIAKCSMDADALSTAVFVMGYDNGKKLIESLPETEVIFVFNDSTIRKTSNVNFILTDNSYRLKL